MLTLAEERNENSCHLQQQISCAFELKLTLGYISLFLTNSFTVGVDFEFQHEFHLLLQLSSKDSVREGSRKVRFAPTSLAQMYLF